MKTKKVGLLLISLLFLAGAVFMETENAMAYKCMGISTHHSAGPCDWVDAAGDSCVTNSADYLRCSAGWDDPDGGTLSVCLVNDLGNAPGCLGPERHFEFCKEEKCTDSQDIALNVRDASDHGVKCWVSVSEAGEDPPLNFGAFMQGYWDYSTGKSTTGQCVICDSNNRETCVLGDGGANNVSVSTGLYCTNLGEEYGLPLNYDDGGYLKFEYACGADKSCDEEDTGNVCTGGHCDKNGICCLSPKIVNGDGDCELLSTCDTDPTIVIDPPSKNGSKGAELTYKVELTNNDDNSCPTAFRTFNLTQVQPGGWGAGGLFPSISAASKKNADGSTNPMTIFYKLTSPGGAAVGLYDFTITATDADGSGSGTGHYVIDNCPPGIEPGVNLTFDKDVYNVGDTMKLSLNPNGSVGATHIVIANPSGGFESSKVNVPIGASRSVTYTAELPTGAWRGIGGAIDCFVTAEVVAAGPLPCTDSWDPYGVCDNYPNPPGSPPASQISPYTGDCPGGSPKTRPCCDINDHCVPLITPICDTSVPPGVCVECLTTPDCNWKGPDYVCENKVCIPCKGEGETATAAHLCCYGLNWLNGICTSACDPNAWFFCNPLRGNVETLVEGGERIIGYILGLIGSVALLLIIISGAMYMTSAGSEERIASSKKILTAAVIGLAIALLSYSLLLVIMTVLGM